MSPKSRKGSTARSDERTATRNELMRAVGYHDLLDFCEHDPRGLYGVSIVASLWEYLTSQADTGLIAYCRRRLVLAEDLPSLRRHHKEFTISIGSLQAFCALLRRNIKSGRGLNADERGLLMDWVSSL
jgi:hypothetical protein